MGLKRWLQRTRKGASRLPFNITRMAEAVRENKEQVITVSIVLYLLGYALIGAGGISFQSQTAAGYVRDDSDNSNCIKGALWVNGDDLQWCATSSDIYEVRDEGRDHIGTESPSSSAPGALWVQGVTLRYQNEAGDTTYHIGGEEVDTGCSAPGAIWLENSPGIIHYCVADGSNDEWTVCNLDPEGLCPDG